MNLVDIVKGVAPTIATALGGPLAGAAVTFLADKLGASDKTQEAVTQIIQGVDPVKMKELDNQFQVQMAQMGISLQLAQIAVNTEEAKSTSKWVAGWRPGIGWVGVVSLALIYIPKAIVLTSIWTYQAVLLISTWHGVGPAPIMPAFPDLGVTDLIGLLGSILGIGGLRTIEKRTGTESNR